MKLPVRVPAIAVCALFLGACATLDDDNDPRDVIGSRLSQPPPGSPPVKPIDAGDIAIVGQQVAHAIVDLPPIASATVPPMVRFTGVTSIMNHPIDTDPYTELLRYRLLLLTREKLRFVERTLPAYVPKKHKHESSVPSNTGGEADYEVLAELRGHTESDFYKIQVEFVDLRSRQVLFNELYRIRPESASAPAPEAVSNPSPEPPQAPASSTPSAPTPPPVEPHSLTTPTTTAPSRGNETL